MCSTQKDLTVEVDVHRIIMDQEGPRPSQGSGIAMCHIRKGLFSPVAKESMSVSYHIEFTWDRVLSFPQFNFKKQAPSELLIYYNKSFETEMEQMIIEIKSLPYNIGKK